MNFTDFCLITTDVPRLVKFYETLFTVKAEGDQTHSFLHLPGLGVAVYSKAAAERDMGFVFSGSGTGLFTMGFQCDDVQEEYQRIRALGICTPTSPQLWPWGACSFRFSDPDGNLIVIRSWPKGN